MRRCWFESQLGNRRHMHGFSQASCNSPKTLQIATRCECVWLCSHHLCPTTAGLAAGTPWSQKGTWRRMDANIDGCFKVYPKLCNTMLCFCIFKSFVFFHIRLNRMCVPSAQWHQWSPAITFPLRSIDPGLLLAVVQRFSLQTLLLQSQALCFRTAEVNWRWNVRCKTFPSHVCSSCVRLIDDASPETPLCSGFWCFHQDTGYNEANLRPS